MYKENFDIDEQLAILWNKVYAEIVRIVDHSYGREKIITLSETTSIKAISVTSDGVILIYDVDRQMSDAEEFEDNVLYEVYRNMQRML